MQLRTKLFLLLATAALVPLLTILFYAGYLGSRTLSEQVDEDMQALLERGALEIRSVLEDEKAAARALAEAPVLRDSLAPMARGNVPSALRDRLQRFLVAYQKAKPSVQAVRLLDAQGRSRIKVKEGKVVPPERSSPNGVPVVNDLSHKDFFQKASGLDVGEVGLSNFELGRVTPEADFCPAMIRYLVPLGLGGEKVGYLVINGWGRRFDQVLSGLLSERKGQAFLAEVNRRTPSRDGVFLYHPRDELRFANQRGNSAYLATRLGDRVAGAVRQNQSGLIPVADSGDRLYFTRLSPFEERDQSWVLGIRAHTGALLAPTNKMQASIAGVGAVALVAILLLSHWAAATVTTPIHRLARKVRRMAAGDWSVRCRSRRVDELGSLARTFDYLADSLLSAHRERDAAEAQARQAAKLASLGEMAGGLAHEINNPLNNIRSLATLVERDLPADVPPRVHRDLATLRSECEQGSRIIQGLLDFGRQRQSEFGPVAAPELVERAVGLLERKAQSFGVGLSLTLTDDRPLWVWADAVQLQQVLVNTILNALQASPRGEEVTAGVEGCGERVRFWIVDHGYGIAEADRQRVFDPFFSTKPEGQGSGLGLSVSHGIVHQHGGEIRVDSLPGRGTTVVFDLPRSTDREGRDRRDRSQVPAPRNLGEPPARVCNAG